MSHYLEQLEGEERHAECVRNDRAMRTMTHAHLLQTTRRYPRSAGEAFKDAAYSNPFEPHIPPPLWARVALFIRRRFA